MLTIGVDVGGTKVLGVAVDTDDPATVLAELRVPTPEGGAGLVDAVLELVAALEAQVGTPSGLGVGVPGLVDRHGVLHMGPHLRHLAEVPLASMLHGASGLRTAVDNDANCHAVAEHAGGAAQGADEALVVTLGTGIGAGIITGGQLLHGANGFAGEPGHMIVDPNGPPCPCGKRGCWERFGSGSGLGRLARDAALGHQLDAVVALAGGDPEDVRGEHVTAAARSGDAEAIAVLGEFTQWIALGLANLANILDPEVIVIGGGLVDAADVLLPEVRARFARLVMAGELRPELPILPAALGGRAGAVGAAVLAATA
jgi:glucokinase